MSSSVATALPPEQSDPATCWGESLRWGSGRLHGATLAGQFGNRMHLQRREDAAAMRPHGQRADGGKAGDLLAGEAARHQIGELLLVWAEAVPA